MTERASLRELVQVGVEGAGTPGTAVAASKLLQSMSWMHSPAPEVDAFRSAGVKYPTVAALNRETANGSMEGKPTYDEIIYPFSSIWGAGSVSTPDAALAPTARLWSWAPSSTAEDVPKTFTVEQGQSTRAHRVAYALLTDFTLDFSRAELAMSGSGFARALTDGITMTASPTALPVVPILPGQGSVYMDATSAALGGTKFTRLLKGSFKVAGRWGSLWVVDAAQASFAAHLETEPVTTLELTVEVDTQGMGMLTNLRANAQRFFRVAFVGSLLGGTTSYQIWIDLAGRITSISDFADEDGVYAATFTAQAFHDSTWGKAVQASVINTTAVL